MLKLHKEESDPTDLARKLENFRVSAYRGSGPKGRGCADPGVHSKIPEERRRLGLELLAQGKMKRVPNSAAHDKKARTHS